MNTPELDKQHEIIESGKSDTIADFYVWLYDQGYEICEWTQKNRYEQALAPITLRPEELLAQFFNIDLKLIEVERRAILEELRSENEQNN